MEIQLQYVVPYEGWEIEYFDSVEEAVADIRHRRLDPDKLHLYRCEPLNIYALLGEN